MALTDSLVSHWKLNEESGTRADSHGSNDLNDNNTVLFGTGKLGNAADFELSNSEFLSHPSNSGLQSGDVDLSLAAWVNLESKATTQIIVSKDNSVAGQREIVLNYNTATDRFNFTVFRATDSPVNVVANNLGSPSLATWYFVIAWHDATANTINIQVNNGTVDSGATGGALQAASSASFQIGARQYAGFANYFDGLIDSVSYWKRVLTSDERTQLYNSGAGLDYDDWADTGESPAPPMMTLLGVG